MSSLQMAWLVVGLGSFVNFSVPRWLGIINLVISVNLVRWVHVAILQCRSLAPIRYTAAKEL
jgi:hypothetical protein